MKRARTALLALALPACGHAWAGHAEDVVIGPEQHVLPARLRKLSHAELEASVDAWLGIASGLAAELPPDVRQHGYTINASASVSPMLAHELARLAPRLAERSITEGTGPWAACARTATRACIDRFIAEAANAAWRRPATEDERAALHRLFALGHEVDGRAGTGAAWVLSSLVQSPGFLYLDELGEPAAEGRRRLGDHAIAASLAYAVTGGPPDDELLAAATRGALGRAGEREAQALRLLGKSDTRHHFRRFVLEWLEADRLAQTSKDPAAFGGYDLAKHAMLDETRAFVDEVMVHESGSIRALLAAGYSAIDPVMAAWYGLTPDSVGPRVDLTLQRRVGVLQHASFLSAHAHPDSSSPVKRGDFILRKVLCEEMPRPAELGIEVVIPSVTANVTTRARFEAHDADPECHECHRSIDPLGFGFEQFDAGGRYREREGGLRIDASIATDVGGVARTFTDGAALSTWLATVPEVEDCFARQAFRYWSGQADREVEQTFVRVISGLAPEARGSLVEILLAYVGSELFVLREEPKP